MKIGDRMIGPDYPPLVIAEIGINHGGSLAVAKEMVSLAARSGAECVKHQTHFVEDEMTEDAKRIFPPNANVSIWEVMERSALSREDEVALKIHAESLGLIYLSTPFSRKAADFLNEIGLPAFKIGSGEVDNIPLIRHIATFGKPIIMSTGMQTINSIRPSVDISRSAKLDFALLECTNLYPSPPEIVSLKGVTELKCAFPDAVVGFSDHSIGPEMAIASIALGACVLRRVISQIAAIESAPTSLVRWIPLSCAILLIDRGRSTLHFETQRSVVHPKSRSIDLLVLQL